MDPVPLIVSLPLFALAYVAFRRPQAIRNWLRSGWRGFTPLWLLETIEAAAPALLGVFGLTVGGLMLTAFIMSLGS
ncbi:MAG: hypothetical protein HOV79_15275 [Hamadaea sp.]|nr:hypothetical protein [Hamadaea sp.]